MPTPEQWTGKFVSHSDTDPECSPAQVFLIIFGGHTLSLPVASSSQRRQLAPPGVDEPVADL